MVPKKKRGRKPKNNIVQKENPVFDNGSKIDHLIVCLSSKEQDKDIKMDNKDISGANIDNIDNYKELEKDNNIIKKCWNCCHNIDNNIISYPVKYVNKVFYTYGNFCSFECSARYIFDNYENKELWDKYTLLNLYYNKSRNTINEKVGFAYSRFNLKSFGGNMDIDEYRQNHTNDLHDNYIPPIIPVNNIFHNNEINKYIDNNNDLKIYRKKDINKNNICEKMEITN